MVPIVQAKRAPFAGVIESREIHLFLRVALLTALVAASSRVIAAAPLCEARAIRAHEALPAASLSNWEPVDERSVLIWIKHSDRASLVRLARPLAGLTSAAIITLVDGDGDLMISPCGHDALAVGYGAGEEAPIVSITPLSRRQTTALDPGDREPAQSSV